MYQLSHISFSYLPHSVPTHIPPIRPGSFLQPLFQTISPVLEVPALISGSLDLHAFSLRRIIIHFQFPDLPLIMRCWYLKCFFAPLGMNIFIPFAIFSGFSTNMYQVKLGYDSTSVRMAVCGSAAARKKAPPKRCLDDLRLTLSCIWT